MREQGKEHTVSGGGGFSNVGRRQVSTYTKLINTCRSIETQEERFWHAERFAANKSPQKDWRNEEIASQL